MKRAHRGATILLAAIMVAVFVWWVCHVPYEPERLFRAIPDQATFVSRHKDLGERWNQMYANPLIVSLFVSAGVKPSALKEWAENPEIRSWFNRLAGKDAVIAFLPPRDSHTDAAWVAASWLGGGSQRLRWQLLWQKPREFVRRPSYHGDMFWRVNTPDIEPGMVLTVALVEGALIACLSDSEERMMEILDAWNGLRPSMVRQAPHPAFTPAHMSGGVFDAVWMESARAAGPRQAGRPVGFEFYDVSRTSLACRAYALGARAPDAKGRGDARALAQVLGGAPVWIGGFPLSWALGAGGKGAGVWQAALQRFAIQQKAGIVVAALLGRDFGGRVAGIRVPAVVVAIPLAEPERAKEQLQNTLDFINARSRWGLIPYLWERVGETDIVVIEGTGQNLYSALAPEEKPAYAISGSWLLLAAQAGSLKLLLSRAAGDADACWRKAVVESAPLWAWGDFGLGNDVLRLAFSAYAFKLMLEDAAGSQSRRQRLNEWKAWLDAFEPFQQCTIRAEPWEAGGLMLDIRMGRFCP
jgi:hypothetical protein